MRQEQYDEMLAKVRGGEVVYYNGRSAWNEDDLDFIVQCEGGIVDGSNEGEVAKSASKTQKLKAEPSKKVATPNPKPEFKPVPPALNEAGEVSAQLSDLTINELKQNLKHYGVIPVPANKEECIAALRAKLKSIADGE